MEAHVSGRGKGLVSQLTCAVLARGRILKTGHVVRRLEDLPKVPVRHVVPRQGLTFAVGFYFGQVGAQRRRARCCTDGGLRDVICTVYVCVGLKLKILIAVHFGLDRVDARGCQSTDGTVGDRSWYHGVEFAQSLVKKSG